MKFIDSSILLSRLGQIGVVVIAAGILDGLLGDGSASEILAVIASGAWFILLNSIKIRSKK